MTQALRHGYRTHLDVLVYSIQQRSLKHHQLPQLPVNTAQLIDRLHNVADFLVAFLQVPHGLILDQLIDPVSHTEGLINCQLQEIGLVSDFELLPLLDKRFLLKPQLPGGFLDVVG